jgi:hypothetical protein
MGAVGTALLVKVSMKGMPGGPHTGTTVKGGGGVPTGVGEGTIVGAGVTVGVEVGVGLTIGVSVGGAGVEVAVGVI